MKKTFRNIKTTFLNMDKVLFFSTLILIVFGTLNIVTASSREAVVNVNANINDIQAKISEVENLNVTGERVEDGVEITFTDKSLSPINSIKSSKYVPLKLFPTKSTCGYFLCSLFK